MCRTNLAAAWCSAKTAQRQCDVFKWQQMQPQRAAKTSQVASLNLTQRSQSWRLQQITLRGSRCSCCTPTAHWRAACVAPPLAHCPLDGLFLWRCHDRTSRRYLFLAMQLCSISIGLWKGFRLWNVRYRPEQSSFPFVIHQVGGGDMQGAVHAVPHPEIPGGSLIAVGTGAGTLAAYESLGPSEPRLIGKSSTSGSIKSVSITLAPPQVSNFNITTTVLH